MRYAGDHKQETRARVIREAAEVIRAKGPDGVSVANIMARAGLTHGGFYAHFASKDDLVREAITTMFGGASGSEASAEQSGAEQSGQALQEFIAYYLSTAHRDNHAGGCPMPALSGEIARTSGATKACFSQGVANTVSRVAAALRGVGAEHPESEANALMAQLVGAILLARATDSEEASARILQDCYSQIAKRYGFASQ